MRVFGFTASKLVLERGQIDCFIVQGRYHLAFYRGIKCSREVELEMAFASADLLQTNGRAVTVQHKDGPGFSEPSSLCSQPICKLQAAFHGRSVPVVHVDVPRVGQVE
jgi:hypothetical protein